MIASMMSLRGYLLLAVGVAFITFMMTLLFGPEIARWAVDFRYDSALAGQAGLGRLVMNPLIFIAENGIAGAVMAGVLWPLILIWVLVVIFLFLVMIGTGVADETTQTIIRLVV